MATTIANEPIRYHVISLNRKDEESLLHVPNIMSIGSIVSKLEEECSIDPSQVFE